MTDIKVIVDEKTRKNVRETLNEEGFGWQSEYSESGPPGEPDLTKAKPNEQTVIKWEK